MTEYINEILKLWLAPNIQYENMKKAPTDY